MSRWTISRWLSSVIDHELAVDVKVRSVYGSMSTIIVIITSRWPYSDRGRLLGSMTLVASRFEYGQTNVFRLAKVEEEL